LKEENFIEQKDEKGTNPSGEPDSQVNPDSVGTTD
jgi:hypothetical protein